MGWRNRLRRFDETARLFLEELQEDGEQSPRRFCESEAPIAYRELLVVLDKIMLGEKEVDDSTQRYLDYYQDIGLLAHSYLVEIQTLGMLIQDNEVENIADILLDELLKRFIPSIDVRIDRAKKIELLLEKVTDYRMCGFASDQARTFDVNKINVPRGTLSKEMLAEFNEVVVGEVISIGRRDEPFEDTWDVYTVSAVERGPCGIALSVTLSEQGNQCDRHITRKQLLYMAGKTNCISFDNVTLGRVMETVILELDNADLERHPWRSLI